MFLLGHSYAIAGQPHARGWVNHPKVWTKAPVSCLATLNDPQRAFLGQVREQVSRGDSAKDIAESIYQATAALPANKRDLAVGMSMATAIEESHKRRLFLPENREALKALLRRGASLRGGELDLHRFDFNNPLSLEEKEALRTIYPESAAMIPRIDDPNRATPVFLGDWIVLPKEKLRPNGQFRTITVGEYESELGQKLRDFSRDMDDYIKRDNISNSATSRFFNWSRSHDRVTLEASNRVSILISELEYDYGIPEGDAKMIRSDFSAALQQSDRNIAAGIKKMEVSVATAAALVGITAIVIASPELWPVAAKALTLLTTTSQGVAALSSGAFTLAGSAGKTLVSSGVSAYQGQGSFICNLGSQMFEHGPHIIASTLESAGIGLVTGAVVSKAMSGARHLGVTEKMLREVAKGTITASPLPVLYGAHTAHQEADYYRQLAKEALGRGDEVLARQYEAEAAQREAKAGWKTFQSAVTPIWASRVSDFFLDSLPANESGAASTAGADAVDPYNDINVPSIPGAPHVPDPTRDYDKFYRLRK